MKKGGLPKIVPIILVIVVVGLIIWAIISIARGIFGTDDPKPSSSPTPNPGQTALIETTADMSVRMAVRGPIVADEKFYSYSITISPDSRNMTAYQGYGYQPIGDSQLPNTMAAYEQFVYAEQRANLMIGTPLTGEANDTRGICATGLLYTFEVLQGTNVVQSLWTTSCSGSPGSLKANVAQVSRLFQVQMPEFAKLSANVVAASS